MPSASGDVGDGASGRGQGAVPPISRLHISGNQGGVMETFPTYASPKFSDVKAGMLSLGLERVNPALYSEPRALNWYMALVAETSKVVGIENAE